MNNPTEQSAIPGIYQTAEGKTYRYFMGGIRRCTPEGLIIPRIRMSKKTRKRLIAAHEALYPQPL